MSSPEISVVVPARNGEGSLPALLDSLARQTLGRERFEVVVVDNASSDRTAELARAAGAVVVSEPLPNRSRARNRGIEAARAPWVAFTDADCVASPRWLEELLGCSGRAPLVAGPVVTTVSGERPNAVERLEQRWRFSQEEWVQQGWAATANLMVERAALEALGGFDAAYRHAGEDPDLCLRARAAGFELGWCPAAEVTHEAESRIGPVLRRAFRHGHGAHQADVRLGKGHRAWRDPTPLVSRDRALERLGVRPSELEPSELARLGRLARLSYAARVAGSVWAEIQRTR